MLPRINTVVRHNVSVAEALQARYGLRVFVSAPPLYPYWVNAGAGAEFWPAALCSGRS